MFAGALTINPLPSRERAVDHARVSVKTCDSDLERENRAMSQTVKIILVSFLMLASARVHAATVAEVIAKIKSLKQLGKGSAMKGVRSRFKEFQLQPDFVVLPNSVPSCKTTFRIFVRS
jgi:hypothetical protein